MNSLEFVRKWAASKQSESSTAQEHFIDLCRLVDQSTPNEADPNGAFFAFEKGAKRPDGDGFADVWLKNHFAWEYKGKHKDLGIAYKQVQTYREALGNPPLLVVCDIERFEVHTNWTNTETWIYRFRNADIALDEPVEVTTYGGPAADAPKLTALQVLKALFEEPERLKPLRTTEQITQEAAKLFGRITDDLRKWKVEDMRIARFVTRVMFCMFATDVGLLPRETFSEVINVNKDDPAAFRENLSALFEVMRKGGKFLMHAVPYFNGRLFEDNDVPGEIHGEHVRVLEDLDSLNWADVEPVIFGTLFERVIDPAQRRRIGAHYTSRADIELIVEPVLMSPLRREWDQIKAAAEDLPENAASRRRIGGALQTFHERLASIRVLDPACGSGNFLYVSLALLKALEKEVIAFASLHDVALSPRVHPRQLMGLEISEYARELASIVIWIGYLQWKHRNVMAFDDETPILQPLDQIEFKDAIVDLSDPNQPRIPEWPVADVIVGNPPFLGGKLLRTHLGDEYVDKVFAAWDSQVARESDLCCYWFEQGRRAIEAGRAQRVGLLATQAIRGGANRRVLQRIKETGDIFYAQADRKWIQDGVAVRVSMVGFDDGSEKDRRLNEEKDDAPEHALVHAHRVSHINANLTSAADVTNARRLKENLGISFMGDTKVGPFEISEAKAREMLPKPNPHRKPNSDVVRPWANGLDITRRPRHMWIIDFPPGTTENEAALYEAPFEYVKRHVKPQRASNKRRVYRERWWIHAEARPEFRAGSEGLLQYVATPNLTKYRFFVWLPADTLPDHQLIVFVRDNDYFFGVLHSRAHEVWALLMGTQLEDRPRYTPKSCFDTFPLPHSSPQQKMAIAEAARELDGLRQGWLNPPEDSIAPSELKKRTLTNLYNQRPTWLANAHRKLDEAVFAAYGWPEPPDALSDGEIVKRLLALNLQREPV
ncbi:MAG: DNA methyltransferase [Dehalococcoidia bacterium]|jgi:SAM-dependent methyltransferase